VTRKITRGLARISEGLETSLYLGNLDSLRDWDTRATTCVLNGSCCSNLSPMIS